MISIGKALSGGWKGVMGNKAVFLFTSILVVVLAMVFGFIRQNVLRSDFFGDPWFFGFVYGWLSLTFEHLVIMGFWVISLKIVRGRKPEVGDVLASVSSILPIAILTLILLGGNQLFEKAALSIVNSANFPELLQWGASSNPLSGYVPGGRLLPFLMVVLPQYIFSLMIFFSMCFVVDRKMGLLDAIRATVETAWGHKMYLFLFSLALLGALLLLVIIIGFTAGALNPQGPISGALSAIFILVAVYIVGLMALISIAHVYEGITSESPA